MAIPRHSPTSTECMCLIRKSWPYRDEKRATGPAANTHGSLVLNAPSTTMPLSNTKAASRASAAMDGSMAGLPQSTIRRASMRSALAVSGVGCGSVGGGGGGGGGEEGGDGCVGEVWE